MGGGFPPSLQQNSCWHKLKWNEIMDGLAKRPRNKDISQHNNRSPTMTSISTLICSTELLIIKWPLQAKNLFAELIHKFITPALDSTTHITIHLPSSRPSPHTQPCGLCRLHPHASLHLPSSTTLPRLQKSIRRHSRCASLQNSVTYHDITMSADVHRGHPPETALHPQRTPATNTIIPYTSPPPFEHILALYFVALGTYITHEQHSTTYNYVQLSCLAH